MEIKDFCSYELSMKLKEAGFNEETLAQWAAEPDGKPALMSSALMPAFRNSDLRGRDVSAPLLYEARNWLIKKRCHIQVMLNDVRTMFFVRIYKKKYKGKVFDIVQTYDNYNDALAAGIEAALYELQRKGE